MNKTIKSFFVYYLPLFFWAGVIFYFSSVPELKVGVGSSFWQILYRKIAHFGEYAVLAFFLFRVFRARLNIITSQSILFTLTVLFFYALSDEAHQLLVSGRSGRMVDVGIDFVGGIFGAVFSGIVYDRKIKFFSVITLVLALGLFSRIVYDMERERKNLEEEFLSSQSVPSSASEKILKEKSSDENDTTGKAKENNPDEKTTADVPKSVKLAVPFTPQAPYANWDEIHEDACEEASLIMVKAFLDKKSLTQEFVEREILALVEHQKKRYGEYKDSDMSELVQISKEYYGMKNLKVVYDFSEEDIKKELVKGNPIIFPVAGQRLGNPNFSGAGPLYHVLVATGYEGGSIITNDPGTRKGASYRYDFDHFYSVIHDFAGKKEDTEKGRKAMVVVE